MHNTVMCKLNLYDVIGITRHLHIKLKSFSNIAQPLHKEAVCVCPFLCIIAKKSGIMSEAFLVDVSIDYRRAFNSLKHKNLSTVILRADPLIRMRIAVSLATHKPFFIREY